MSDSDLTHQAREADLADVERRRLRALVEAELVVVDQLHASDFQLITPAGDSLSKEEYLGAIASGEINYLLWEPGDIDARARDAAGCVRYQSTIKIVVAGREIGPGRYWHTDFYERTNGRWQVVWSQATEIPGAGKTT